VERVRDVYEKVNRLSGGGLGAVKRAVQHFGDAGGSAAAAAIAYYALFSLFPLLLLLISVGSRFLQSEQVYSRVLEVVREVIPVSQGLVEENVQEVARFGEPVGIVSGVGLVWSASGVFTLLIRNINKAWAQAEQRSFVKRRLMAIGIVGLLLVLLILSLASTTLFSLLPRVFPQQWAGISVYNTLIWKALSAIIPLLFSLFLFVSLYRWVPNTKVSWSQALWGGIVAAAVWEAAKRGFAWYLSAGLARYRVVYGSLGTVVALMFWTYLSAWIALFGAHVSAAIRGEG
jgi:membrane protein